MFCKGFTVKSYSITTCPLITSIRNHTNYAFIQNFLNLELSVLTVFKGTYYINTRILTSNYKAKWSFLPHFSLCLKIWYFWYHLQKLFEILFTTNNAGCQSRASLQFSVTATRKSWTRPTSDKLVILKTNSWVKVMVWSLKLFVTLQVQGLAFENWDILP